jgi:mitochondrial chaperone BCS1
VLSCQTLARCGVPNPAAIPEEFIFLLKDIDCAFPPREDADDPSIASPYSAMMIPGARNPKSNVTLSGLLNVLDGMGSEKGNLFFAMVHLSKQDLGVFTRLI